MYIYVERNHFLIFYLPENTKKYNAFLFKIQFYKKQTFRANLLSIICYIFFEKLKLYSNLFMRYSFSKIFTRFLNSQPLIILRCFLSLTFCFQRNIPRVIFYAFAVIIVLQYY